ncbi:MAG: hypothetical protein ACLU0O_04100 [Collinsella sp.]
MDIDNFEWWYSEGARTRSGRARVTSSDEDETGNDAASLTPPPMLSPDL